MILITLWRMLSHERSKKKIKRKKKVLLTLYLAVCLVIIVAAYFHLSRIARNFNTEHLELITGLYAEKDE